MDVLNSQGVQFESFNILSDNEIREGLKVLYSVRSCHHCIVYVSDVWVCAAYICNMCVVNLKHLKVVCVNKIGSPFSPSNL